MIDTHVALTPDGGVRHEGEEHWGITYCEHTESDTLETKAKRLRASADNIESFWFTRPSLPNILSSTGFSSVYERFVPIYLDPGRPGLEHRARYTFVALKEDTCELSASPVVNGLGDRCPKESLTYSRNEQATSRPRSLSKRIPDEAKKLLMSVYCRKDVSDWPPDIVLPRQRVENGMG